MSLGGWEGFVALRYLRGRRKQTALSLISLLSTLGIIVGVAALLIALALMTGFQEEVRRRIVGGNAELTVFGRVHGPGESPDVADPAALVKTLASVPGVESASAFISGFGVLTSGGQLYEYTQVQGVEPDAVGAVLDLRSGDEGRTSEDAPPARFADLAAPTGTGRDPILLGRDLAARLGVAPGDVIKMYVLRVRLAPWGPVPRAHHFEVAGTVRSGFAEFDAHRAYVALDTARGLYGLPHAVSWVSARLAPGSEVHDVRPAVERAVGLDHAVVDIIEQNREFFSALRLEKLLLFLAVGLIVAVGALGIVTTLLILVMEKVRDIGALVAMGATPASVTRIFVFQGMIVGLLGCLAGAALGGLSCWTLNRWRLIRLDPDVYYIDHLPFVVRPLDLFAVVLVAFLVSLLATIWPAWKAARLDPVEALHHD